MVVRIEETPTTPTTKKKKKKTTISGFLLPLGAIIVAFLVGFQVQTSLKALESTSAATTWLDSLLNSNPLQWMTQQDEGQESSYSDEYGPLNVLILYPDDWRYDAIGDANPPQGVVHTPFLTKLAQEGIRFTHNAVTTSICWISRATLFTGRYVSQHQSPRLFCPIFTMPQFWNSSWVSLLQQYRNYYVGHVGKWQYHNQDTAKLFNWSSFHEGHHWYRIRGKGKIHASHHARDDAIRFLKERPKDHPFALTVAFYPPKPLKLTPEPGSQWEPDDEHKAMYDNQTFRQPYNYSQAFAYVPPFLKRGYTYERWDTRWKTSIQYQASMKHYFALVSHIDDACRDIVTSLDEEGILNRTMIIISADNGLFLGAHGLGGKWHPYQESIRVPLIVYDPRMAQSKRGTTNDAYTLNIDLAPTILGAAQLPIDPRMQGRDLADLYVRRKGQFDADDTSPNPWRQDFYYEFPLPEFPSSSSLVTRQYKYIQWQRSGGLEQLFDLQQDPYELNDLLKQSPSSRPQIDVFVEPTTSSMLPQQQQQYNPQDIEELRNQLRQRHKELERQANTPHPGDETVHCVRQAKPPWP